MRVQYTIFWGGFRDMFTNDGRSLREGAARNFVRYVARRLAQHPEHTVEIINEADHGHHMGRFGRTGYPGSDSESG